MGNNDQRDQQSGKTAGNTSSATNQSPATPQGPGDRKDARASEQSGGAKGVQGNTPAGDRKDAAPKGDTPTKA